MPPVQRDRPRSGVAPATRMMFNRVPSRRRAATAGRLRTHAPSRIRRSRLPASLPPTRQLAAWHDADAAGSALTTAVRRMLPRPLADRVRVAEADTPSTRACGRRRRGRGSRPPAHARPPRRPCGGKAGTLLEYGCACKLRTTAARQKNIARINRIGLDPAAVDGTRARRCPTGRCKAALERFLRRAGDQR